MNSSMLKVDNKGNPVDGILHIPDRNLFTGNVAPLCHIVDDPNQAYQFDFSEPTCPQCIKIAALMAAVATEEMLHG